MLAEVTELVERLLSELPPATAALNVYRVPRNGGPVVELKPTNSAAAAFGIHSDDFAVYSFSFGVRSQWDVHTTGVIGRARRTSLRRLTKCVAPLLRADAKKGVGGFR